MNTDGAPTDDKPRPLSRYLLSMTLLAIVVIIVVPIYILHEQREDDLRWIETEISGQAGVISEHVDSSLEAVDLILRSVVKDRQRDLKGQTRTDKEVTMALQSMIQRRPEFHRVLITNKAGEIIYSNNVRSIGSSAARLRSYKVHVKRSKPGLFTGELVHDNKKKQQYLALSRPYFTPKGKFAGVAISVLKRTYFVKLMKSVTQNETFTATLLNKQGRILATSGEAPEDTVYTKRIDINLFDVPMGETATTKVRGAPFAEAGLNIIAQSSVSGFPYVVMTSISQDRALKAWRKDAFVISAISVLALLLVITMFFLARQEGLKRIAIEKNLVIEKDRAEQATKAKSEFLSSMSHELRTPLNAIIGFAQILMSSKKLPLQDKQHRSVEHILNGGNHLLRLINEILDLAKIEAGRMELTMEAVTIDSLFKECRDLTDVTASNANIELVFQPEPTGTVKVDKKRTIQVLLNLISNAIKYNRPNGSVSVICENSGDHFVKILVKDTGHGITPAAQQELFKPFSRVGDKKSEIEGTGIGLTIVKNLVEMMEGTIGLESEEDKGSTFWIELVRAEDVSLVEEEAQDEENGGLAEEAGKGGKVIYVEDNQVNQLLMETIFEELPQHTLLMADDAEVGLEMVHRENPDIILMDINLPGMSGYDALKKIQEDQRTSNIPVIAVSAAAMVPDIQRGMEAGFFAYVTKPFNVREIIDACRRAMDKE